MLLLREPCAVRVLSFSLCAAAALAGCGGEQPQDAVAAVGETDEELKPDPTRACRSDADCFHTGCSGAVCASQDVNTTCVFTCETACYQQASCGCHRRHCGFRRDRHLRACLAACKQQNQCPHGPACGARDACPAGERCCNGCCQPGGLVCRAPGVPCGTNVCGPGEYCCNPSCGICAPRGVLCIQKTCEPDGGA